MNALNLIQFENSLVFADAPAAGMSVGAIIGIIIGAVILLIFFFSFFPFFRLNRNFFPYSHHQIPGLGSLQ